MDDENTKSIAIAEILSKIIKQRRNKGSTELYCLFTAADSIVDDISFIRRIVLWSKNKFSQIWMWLRLRLWLDLSS